MLGLGRSPVLCLVLVPGLASLVACKSKDDPKDTTKSAPAPETDTPRAAEAEPPAELPKPSSDSSAIADAVDAGRFEADLRLVAAPRPPGSSHWRAVQDRCAAVFEAAGLTTSRFETAEAGTSVIGDKKGTDPELPALVIGAHYDHIPDCAGADDNASGTAALLELVRVLGEKTWPRTLTFACWDEEESGLEGSRAWADAAVAEGRSIGLYLNFDAIAYASSEPGSQSLPPGMGLMFGDELATLKANDNRADFIAVLADAGAHASSNQLLAHAERLELPATLLELPGSMKNSPALADLRRWDHASFWAHDIPAIFLSDTANFRTDTYHCRGRPDTVETLDLEFATKVVRAAAGASADYLAGKNSS